MDQQDHIATLCAAGTLGIAATGLALGVQSGNQNTYFVTPGKRKWPGASSLKSPSTTQPSLPSRRVASQPVPSNVVKSQDKNEITRSASLFRRPSRRDNRPNTASDGDPIDSRGSSLNRSGMFRPRTADTRSTSERRDPSTSSSWLKRLSAVSSTRASSPNPPSSKLDSSPQTTPSSAIDSLNQALPNKLVKRSLSQRALSADQARGVFLRRPATSHQRSATVQEWVPCNVSASTPATPYLSSESGPVWRPFFERGYARKRQATGSPKDNPGLRTISLNNGHQATLILGSQLEASDNLDDDADADADAPAVSSVEAKAVSHGRQRLRRSLSSIQRAARRRHFTDPTVKVTNEAVNGTMTAAVKRSPFSPATQPSSFDLDLPNRTPSFTSSPPLYPVRHRFSFRKRQSTVPSDPTTASSDNDTRVFTDDDSMDCQSDTAYDSLTTRATASSHSALRTPRLDTIFNDPHISQEEGADAALARLVQKATLTDETIDQYEQYQRDQLRGIGITQIEEENDKMDYMPETGTNMTPKRSTLVVPDDHNETPIPHRGRYFESPLKSSPPVLSSASITRDVGTPEFVVRPRQFEEEDGVDIDWSPKSDNADKEGTTTLRQSDMAESDSHPPAFTTIEEDSDSEKRLSSIFDWSEYQKVGGENLHGIKVRPKTVHGKQGNDGSRSRSSGRKGPTQMHLRSQSVPNNRDSSVEPVPHSTSKFGTWGLGNKPVSEEWSDDFEFDDADEEPLAEVVISGDSASEDRGTLRGVKVPQAIIDRQASVHLQFGQVQEFMLFVEELKNLRAKGAALQLLETHSKQLWEDAESIIDLATINNEDDPYLRPSSPTTSDIFGDEISSTPKGVQDKPLIDEQKRNSAVLRSVSSPATPPQGRPRGESLAQAKNLLQSIHQSRSGFDSSPLELDNHQQKKLPFDTQDLKDLVVRSGVITRALKEIVRKAEGLSVSPTKTPPKTRDPPFSQIFNAPDVSPCPPFRKPGLPKSKSANSYLLGTYAGSHHNVPTSPTPTALVL